MQLELKFALAGTPNFQDPQPWGKALSYSTLAHTAAAIAPPRAQVCSVVLI